LAVLGWIPYSSAWCQGHVGSYRYIPSWPVLKTDATQGLHRVILIHILESLAVQRHGSPSQVIG
jgi:hypothetical protein